MLYKTKGIVLNFIKYKETSIIVKIFTEKFGLKSYIVNRVRTSRGKKSKMAFFQPLTMLDLVVYNRKNASIHRISEMQVYAVFRSIPYHIVKSTICIFVGEVLLRSVQEEEGDFENVYAFLENSILFLDEAEACFELFHLQFMLKWSHFLGISIPAAEETETMLPVHQMKWLSEEVKSHFNQLILSNYGDKILIPDPIRDEILDYVLQFYGIHLDHFRDLKSLDVLRML